MIRLRTKIAVLSVATGLVSLPLLAEQRPAGGPVARYDMRAGTISGAGAMGRGMGGAMSMMMGGGGGNTVQHELYLRLGTGQAPSTGAPKADHFMPPAAKLGKSVPLITPQVERAPVDGMPGEKPKGRMLIFWGCGEHAPKGQPLVIDFAKLAAGQVPPGMWSSTVLRDWGPSLANSRTFARWPNDDAQGGNKAIKADASLIGDHRVSANYTPEIAFHLSQDFMVPLKVNSSPSTGGGLLLRWNAMSSATGFHATLFGGSEGARGGQGDMVMWSSSATRQFGAGLDDWISPGQAATLVRDRVLLPGSATSCIVPAEVRQASQFRMGSLIAFGPQEDFAYPQRPANPKLAWNPVWTARIRYRSKTSWMDMAGMSAMEEDDRDQPQKPTPKCRPRGLGGIMGGVLGGSGC